MSRPRDELQRLWPGRWQDGRRPDIDLQCHCPHPPVLDALTSAWAELSWRDGFLGARWLPAALDACEDYWLSRPICQGASRLHRRVAALEQLHFIAPAAPLQRLRPLRVQLEWLWTAQGQARAGPIIKAAERTFHQLYEGHPWAGAGHGGARQFARIGRALLAAKGTWASTSTPPPKESVR